jgi:putative ABC transport system permease protein
VVERTREIGMLRTLGMSRRQILEQILVEAAIIGVIGSILGILGGLLLARGLISIMALVIGQEVTTLRVPTSGLLVAAAVGILVTLAAAALPARQASRVSPLEALRIRAGSREGWFVRKGPLLGVALLVMTLPVLIAGPLPAFVPERARDMLVMNLFLAGTLLIPAAVSVTEPVARRVLARVFGVEGQLGSRNVQRARLRTALTVAALMIGAAMILSIRSVTVAFDQDIRAWIERYIGGDIYVHSTLDMDTRLGLRLGQVAGVAAVTPLRYLEAKRIMPDGRSEDLAIMAVDVPTYQEVTSFVFSGDPGDVDRLARGDAVFISSVLSEKYGLQQGDTVRLATRRGRRDFEVAGVVVDFFNQGMVLQLNWDDMKRYFGRDDANTFLVKVQPGESTAAVRVRIEEEYGRRHHLTVESNEAIRARALALIARTTSLFDVMSLITMIVAALGVINTLTMNVVERTREIGMLRSLGMTRRQIGRMILAEAGMMGLVGGLFGLLFGILVSRTIMTSMNQMSGFQLPWVLPAEGIVAALIITFVVSQIAALWPARRAARIRITEAIQYE